MKELKEAIRLLAAQCDFARRRDAVGFNRIDAEFGHRLAGLSEWTPKQALAAWKLCQKYRRQLALLGIDAEKLPKPEIKEENEVRQAFTMGDGMLYLEFPYDASLVAEIRRLPGRFWLRQMKAWRFSIFSEEVANQLIEFLNRHGFEISKEAEELLLSPPVPRIKLEVRGDFISVKLPKFQRFQEALQAIKEIAGRRWNGERKEWLIPLSQASVLLDKLKDFDNVEVPYRLFQQAELQRKKKKELLELSKAEDTEVCLADITNYDKLYPFQRAGVVFIKRVKHCLVADEMGLGKTVQSLIAAEALSAFPLCVVSPASVKLFWQREAKKWLPHRTVSLWRGRNNHSGSKADIIILNYDILEARLSELLNIPFKGLILDESHFVKNYKAKRSRAALALSQLESLGLRLCLTGTPLLNRPIELVNQLRILKKLREFGGFWYFVKRYCEAHQTRWGWDMSGAAHLDELSTRLRETCMLRRRKEDVLKELPDKRRVFVPLELENPGKYYEVEADFLRWVEERAIEEADFLAKIAHLPEQEQKRMKAIRANSAIARALRAEQLVRIEALKQVVVEEKLNALIDWVHNFLESEKLVLFAHHRKLVERLAKEFAAPYIIGEQNAKERQRAIDSFQAGKQKLIVCSLKAGGIGITLTAASNVAFAEVGWTPAEMNQAEDRVHRIGQKTAVTCWYLLASETIEEDIMNLIDKKREIVTAAIEGEEVRKEEMVSALICRMKERREGYEINRDS